MTRYLLDTNVFIEAKQKYYDFAICPAFWKWLILQNQAGNVASIKMVLDELRAQNDDLTEWAETRGDDFFLKPDNAVDSAIFRVSDWANNQQYTRNSIETFLRVADYRLVAQALGQDWIVVTHELPSMSVKKIKIPNACEGLGISYMNPFEMLRREKARFIMDPRM